MPRLPSSHGPEEGGQEDLAGLDQHAQPAHEAEGPDQAQGAQGLQPADQPQQDHVLRTSATSGRLCS